MFPYMKKIILITAFASIALTACQKELVVSHVEDYSLTASHESVLNETKSTVSDAGAFSWSKGDAIALWNGTNFSSVLRTDSEGASVIFSGTLVGEVKEVAYYPSTIGQSKDKIVLPATYEWTEGQTNSPMIAEFSGTNPASLEFKNLGGLIKVCLKNIPVGAAKFVFTTDKDITGEYDVVDNAGGKKEIVSSGSNNNNVLTFTFETLTAAAADMDFYVPVPVGSYTIKVELQKEDGTKLWGFAGSKANTVVRNQLVRMPALTIASVPGGGESSTTSITIPAAHSGDYTLPSTKSDVKVVMESNTNPVILNYASSGERPANVQIDGGSNTIADLTINLPESHVELSGTAFNTVTSTTSENTLVVGKDVNITTLKIEGGSAQIYGTVNSVVRGENAGVIKWYVGEGNSLVKAATVADNIVLTEDIDLTETVLVRDKRTVVIDMNGKNITKDSAPFDIYNAKVTFDGVGTIAETKDDKYGALMLRGSGEDNVADYTVVNIGKDITLKGWSGIFVAKDDKGGYYNYGLVVNCSAKIVRAEGFTKDAYGIYINGSNVQTDSNAPKFNLENSDFSVRGAGIYAAGYAQWNLKNTNIVAGNAAVEIRAGEMTIEGGSFESKADPLEVEPNGNGTTVAGAALGISQHSTNLPINVTVNGGTFNGVYSVWEKDVQDDKAQDVIKMTLNGGTYKGAVYSQNNNYAIHGGTFSDPSALNYLAGDADVTVEIAKGTYGNVFKAQAGTAVIRPAVAGEEVVIAGIDASSNGSNAKFTFEGITFDNSLQTSGWFTGTAQNIYPCVGAWGGSLSFKNCKFVVDGGSGKETGVMTWWTVKENKVNLSFIGCTFEGKDNAKEARAMQIYDHVDLDVDGCTFTTAKRYAIKYAAEEGCVANIKNNKVSNCQYIVELGSSEYPGTKYTVNFENNILDSGIADYKVAHEEGATINGGTAVK